MKGIARYDVVVLGGGPAGLATAVALSRLGRSVAVLERTRYERPRAGETFGGELRPLLQELGAWEAFENLEPVPFRGVRSAWGGAELVDRPSLFNPFGDGWHVDRARFDEVLARCAEQAGVEVRRGSGTASIERRESSDQWLVRSASSSELTARFAVDASGRGAPAGVLGLPERRWLQADRLVALVGSMAPPGSIERELLLEAVEEGWWYSVPQPDGRLLGVLMTDADLLPARGPERLAEHFRAALARSAHTSARAAGASLAGPPWIVRADSGILLPDRGECWRAVGDAAMACDPLAGDGVVRSLRFALEAAVEIDQELKGERVSAGGEALLPRFRDYLDTRGRYYERERRWPDATFWARRRPLDWKTAPLFLDPRRLLRWDGTPPRREVVAPVEALLPPPAVRALLDRLRTPTPAHEALELLRRAAPLEDRKLLVGLQYLVYAGCISSDTEDAGSIRSGPASPP